MFQFYGPGWKSYITFESFRRPRKGFREPEEWRQEQSGSQEQAAKKFREQEAEEINLGSMEHSLYHEISVLQYENFF